MTTDKMIVHDLVQGSAEWVAHRFDFDNASDGPAMLNESPYKTRTELLHEKFTGITGEVNASTQKIFDDGHRFEALARPLAEEIIGEDLYPVVATRGRLGASFDGLTFSAKRCFEHKTLNDAIRAAFSVNANGDHVLNLELLPLVYKIQMEQQLIVSGADDCLFMATRWQGDQCAEMRFGFYRSDAELRERIIQGWQQFHRDLEDFKPRDIVEKPKAAAILELPPLSIQLRGEVTLSTLPQFKVFADEYIGSISTELVTDQDFANAEATVKFLDAAEKRLDTAKEAAQAQTADISAVMRTLDQIRDDMKAKRLTLTKLVADKKASIRTAIVIEANQAYKAYVAELEKEIAPYTLGVGSPNFAEATKHKRTLASLHDAVDAALAEAKSFAFGVQDRMKANLAWFEKSFEVYGANFPDLGNLISKPSDDFEAIVCNRVDQVEKARKDRAEKLAAERARAKQTADDLAKAQAAETPQDAPAQKADPIAQAQPENAPANDSSRPERPSCDVLILSIALSFQVDKETARSWLIEAFSPNPF